MKRHEVTDEQWEVIQRILPKRKAKTGRPPSDPRLMLNGILWISEHRIAPIAAGRSRLCLKRLPLARERAALVAGKDGEAARPIWRLIRT
jgi:transposase